jgi:hypothetical protein
MRIATERTPMLKPGSPPKLTWWKRGTTTVIERICDALPYPWGDRIEASIGNFGLWVQITIAIVFFRVFVWLVVWVLRLVYELTTGRARHRPKSVRGGRF